MKGVVVDEKDGYVKAAIVKIMKARDTEAGDEAGDEAEAITYVRTDENGSFFIRDLNPEEEYIIEIHLEDSGSGGKAGDPADADELIKPNHDLREKLYQIRNSTWC